MLAVKEHNLPVMFQLEPVAEELITQMITTMDDDNKSTRLISCRVLTRTFDTMGNALDQDRLHNLYPELLKRLDDSSDEIRMMVTRTFLAYFDCFQNKYDVGLYRAHLEALYKGLLVHLDDPEEKIQEGVLGKSPEFCFMLFVLSLPSFFFFLRSWYDNVSWYSFYLVVFVSCCFYSMRNI